RMDRAMATQKTASRMLRTSSMQRGKFQVSSFRFQVVLGVLVTRTLKHETLKKREFNSGDRGVFHDKAAGGRIGVGQRVEIGGEMAVGEGIQGVGDFSGNAGEGQFFLQ